VLDDPRNDLALPAGSADRDYSNVGLGDRIRACSRWLTSLVRSLLDLLVLRRKTEAALQIEVLALSHQLRVLERQVHRPRFQPDDRLLLSALSRLLPRPAWRCFLACADTLLRWHRELVRLLFSVQAAYTGPVLLLAGNVWKWALYARRPPRGRPGQSPARRPSTGRRQATGARGSARRRDPPVPLGRLTK